jgi:hypothetical protein
MIMFGPSLKSVPGCLVSMVPMLIGLPVAFTPGLGPHDEVSDDVAPPPELLEAAAVDVAPPPAEDELLLLLLPQPAKTATKAIAPSNARTTRTRGTTYLVLTDLSSPQ